MQREMELNEMVTNHTPSAGETMTGFPADGTQQIVVFTLDAPPKSLSHATYRLAIHHCFAHL